MHIHTTTYAGCCRSDVLIRLKIIERELFRKWLCFPFPLFGAPFNVSTRLSAFIYFFLLFCIRGVLQELLQNFMSAIKYIADRNCNGIHARQSQGWHLKLSLRLLTQKLFRILSVFRGKNRDQL